MRILYDSKSLAHKRPFGTLREGEKCEIEIFIPQKCKTTSVQLQLFLENGESFASFFLKPGGMRDENYEIWGTSFALAVPDLYFYRFYIKTQEGEFPLYKEDFAQTNMWQGDFWQLSCIPIGFRVPEEYAGKVMYQIFPDRFYKSGETNCKGKLEPYWVHETTNELPDFRPDREGVVRNCDFFGGNLRGIKEKLPYLKRLGVSVVYLNPIFKAYSNHRYDTADYKKIDELLGTEEGFSDLCKKAHELDMKIILDGVFSHTGSNSIYFDRYAVFGGGAYSDPNSPYRAWFDFQEYPDRYTSWWGIETLPCVNEMNPSYRAFIYGDEDSVIAHWLRLGADGFRLDVADELPDAFIKELREKMKQINPRALLIGEVWEDASNKSSYGVRRRYFSGGELDSVMNYPFRNAVVDFVLGNDSGEALRKTVLTLCENYPREVVNVLMNMLSTHDTPRILSVLSGVNPPGDKESRAAYRLTARQRELATARLKCAAFLQFVLPGMPCIYYGDEIGTEGFEDPFCRTFFDWERADDEPLLKFFEQLGDMRNKNCALMHGETQIECIREGLVCVKRKTENTEVTAYINGSSVASEVYDEGKPVLFCNAQIQKAAINLLPYGFVLLKNN